MLLELIHCLILILQIRFVDLYYQMVSYMYRLKGRCGLFIQPAERECTYSDYALKGHGDDADATLGVYHFGIPVEASSYEDFEKGMSTAEKAFMDAIVCRRNVAGLF